VALERIALESLTGRISTNCAVPRSCLGYVPGAVDRERRPANIAPTWRSISAGHIQYRIFGDAVATSWWAKALRQRLYSDTHQPTRNGAMELRAEYTTDPYYEDSLLPVMRSGQAELVATDYAFDDGVWIESWPGHTPGHVCVVVRSPHASVGVHRPAARRSGPDVAHEDRFLSTARRSAASLAASSA
jgi:hypothetical protein